LKTLAAEIESIVTPGLLIWEQNRSKRFGGKNRSFKKDLGAKTDQKDLNEAQLMHSRPAVL